jgi:hypothetical protein
VQVLFHAASSKLITASQDGLVAVHDVAGGLNQDDGFIAALNVGTSVEQLGLYGSEGQHMWCRWVPLLLLLLACTSLPRVMCLMVTDRH